ncbi:outer membrane protein assembly factor BamB family protein [Planctomicrobium piriforme]|uniref:Outer membrane protein assembly factor BamB, contains PQQ-like beta-propeller repeat n=1 Tax=Planctomicrobium piriforme TaxID=1576369 RepID=A0A1I3LRE0_9PLAN|nr:PQQ-binding-like beta-propeller repeat protein [Planctomicrobium piriforme]SFI87339.1 Outer membrane protein assembly factor BamB, contains PQQ-like beta-propeller repeat [Planctomicrobium piriforme]
MKILSLALGVMVLFSSQAALPLMAAAPAPWPQFRGPAGSGLAEDEHPPVEIGPDKNVKWKVSTPGGASSAIVVGDLLVLTAFDGQKLWTIAYRRADGSEAWRADAPYQKLEAYHPTEGSPAASTPATDGERIVSYFGSCGLFCYDLSGKQLWQHAMPPAATVADFGTGVSPILVDGLVILLRDERNAPQILALDVATGKVKWERKRESISGFGTPVIWENGSNKQIVAPGYGRMIAYDLTTGEEAWSHEGMPSASCTTPVVGDGLLYFAGWSPGDADEKGGFKMPTFDQLLAGNDADANKDGVFSKEESAKTPFKDFFDNNDPDKDGLVTRKEWDDMLAFMSRSKNSAFALQPAAVGKTGGAQVLWLKTSGLPYVPSAILYKGRFIMVKDGGIVTGYNARTGEEAFQKRAVAPGEYYSSPVAAGGNLYFTSLKEGVVTVVKLDGDELKTVAKNPPLGERVSATPAIADNTLYLRTAGHLYAFGE